MANNQVFVCSVCTGMFNLYGVRISNEVATRIQISKGIVDVEMKTCRSCKKAESAGCKKDEGTRA